MSRNLVGSTYRRFCIKCWASRFWYYFNFWLLHPNFQNCL